MAIELSVLFKMMQKDDKKEVLKFQIQGDEDEQSENDLFALAGNIVVFSIKGCEAGEISAEFMNMQRDSKKTVIKFAIKGDSDDKAQQIYKFAGRNVDLTVKPSQMSIEEFYEGDEQREGVRGKINSDGTVDVDENQMSIDDAEAEIQETIEQPQNDIERAKAKKAAESVDTHREDLDDDQLPF